MTEGEGIERHLSVLLARLDAQDAEITRIRSSLVKREPSDLSVKKDEEDLRVLVEKQRREIEELKKALAAANAAKNDKKDEEQPISEGQQQPQLQEREQSPTNSKDSAQKSQAQSPQSSSGAAQGETGGYQQQQQQQQRQNYLGQPQAQEQRQKNEQQRLSESQNSRDRPTPTNAGAASGNAGAWRWNTYKDLLRRAKERVQQPVGGAPQASPPDNHIRFYGPPESATEYQPRRLAEGSSSPAADPAGYHASFHSPMLAPGAATSNNGTGTGSDEGGSHSKRSPAGGGNGGGGGGFVKNIRDKSMKPVGYSGSGDDARDSGVPQKPVVNFDFVRTLRDRSLKPLGHEEEDSATRRNRGHATHEQRDKSDAQPYRLPSTYSWDHYRGGSSLDSPEVKKRAGAAAASEAENKSGNDSRGSDEYRIAVNGASLENSAADTKVEMVKGTTSPEKPPKAPTSPKLQYEYVNDLSLTDNLP